MNIKKYIIYPLIVAVVSGIFLTFVNIIKDRFFHKASDITQNTENSPGSINTIQQNGNNVIINQAQKPKIVKGVINTLNDPRAIKGAAFQSTFRIYVSNPSNAKFSIVPKLNSAVKIVNFNVLSEGPAIADSQVFSEYFIQVDTNGKISTSSLEFSLLIE